MRHYCSSSAPKAGEIGAMGWLILAVEELRRLRAVSGHAERFERLITIMYVLSSPCTRKSCHLTDYSPVPQ